VKSDKIPVEKSKVRLDTTQQLRYTERVESKTAYGLKLPYEVLYDD
jgi:hypothetical protein